MNKTVSLIVRIVAILAAVGAGVLWYVINSYNLENAMKRTAWLDREVAIKNLGSTATDNSTSTAGISVKPAVKPEEFIGTKTAAEKEHAEASLFVKRMDSIETKNEGKGVPNLIREYGKKIDELFSVKQQLDQVIVARDGTIKERDTTIAGLEDDKAKLTRDKNKLTDDLNSARSNIAQLEADKATLQSEISQKNAQIAAMFTKEQYNAEIDLRKKAEDSLDRATRTYSRLRNWGWRETGIVPPYPISPTSDKITDNTPKPKEDVKKILTSIAAVDYRRGLLTLFIGKDNKFELKERNDVDVLLRLNQVYDVQFDNNIIGKIRVNEILDGMSVATILPGTNQRFLVRNARISLIRAQGRVEEQQVITNPTAPSATPSATPAAPAAEPAAPASSPFAPGGSAGAALPTT
jgi:hypothetical protein